MKQYKFDDVDALQELVSDDFGEWSNALEITQDMVNSFAELSGDDYWMHTDPQKCKEMSPFGVPIAHGFLSLILLSKFDRNATYEVTGYNNMLNVGSDRLRFTGAVPVGSKVHTRSRVKAIEATPKGTRFTLEQNLNVVGEERPALVYELIFIYM